jgi:hypothetical protein
MVFRADRMSKADVKGWTHGHNDGSWASVVLLHSRRESVRPFEVPLASLKEPEALSWFDGMPNLDDVAAAGSIEKLAADPRYGASSQDRTRSLMREHCVARSFYWIALYAMLWIFVWPTPYEHALSVGFALPALGFILAVALKDRWNPAFLEPADQRPALGALYALTPWALLVRAFDHDILDQTPLLQWGGLFVLCIVAACLFVRMWPSNRLEQAGIVVMASMYAYAAAVQANVLLDRSNPRIYSAEVIEAVSDSELRLAPWGPRARPEEVRVGRGLYEEAPAGSKVEVRLYEGRLGARWFSVHASPRKG